MRVLVTGATGFVGSHTAAAVAEAGHDVRLFVRDRARARPVLDRLRNSGDVAVGDVTDQASVERALVGCDAVVHAAAVVTLDRRHSAEALRVNGDGARNVLGVALAAGARVVHVSSTSALQAEFGVPLSSSSPPSEGSGYGASKAAAERIARQFQDGGTALHITYPSGIIGPAAGGSLGETSTAMAQFVAAGIVPTRHGATSLIDVRDLAAIHLRLLTDPTPPARVMCGGTLSSMEELASILSSVTGRQFPVLPIPPALLRSLGWAADHLARFLPDDIPLTEEGMSLITSWPGTDDDTMRSFGLAYRPLEETLRTSVRTWYAAHLLTRRQAGYGAE